MNQMQHTQVVKLYERDMNMEVIELYCMNCIIGSKIMHTSHIKGYTVHKQGSALDWLQQGSALDCS